MARRRHTKIMSQGIILEVHFLVSSDSLVSTTGLIAGIGASTQDPKFIVLAGLVGVSVEAVSMAAGEFLSEETTNDLKRRPIDKPFLGGLIMLSTYFLAGLLPIAPIMFLPEQIAMKISIVSALAGLFFLGLGKGKITGRPPLRSGLEVLLVGGLACAIGIAVGVYLKAG